MLVLSRKPLQSIMLGSNIKITVVKVERNQVRIGIEAPQDISILRAELLEAASNEARSSERSVREIEIVTT